MLGARIAALRRHAGMTQSDLARHIHVSVSTVGMYEQGRRLPSISMLISLSQEFAVSIDYLILGIPNSSMDISTLASAIRKDIKTEIQVSEKKLRAPTPSADYQLIIEILQLLTR